MKLSLVSSLCAFALQALALSPALAVPVVPHFQLHDGRKRSGAPAMRNDHQVGDLPGLSRAHVPFAHFAGQLALPTNESLFYWFAESQRDPGGDPLVLWLNGGPGCASSNGFLTENGPFVPQPDATLQLNPYAWNRRANVVWVDSPAGVGFSGGVQPGGGDYYNDDVVADRLRAFLSVFLDKYPELKGRALYLTGESYAGMYIPFLAELLLRRPVAGANLQGLAIGNPLTDTAIESGAYLDYYVSHALISPQTHRAVLRDACAGDVSQCFFWGQDCPPRCSDAIARAMASADEDAFNHYYITGDVCLMENPQRDALLVRHVDRAEALLQREEGATGLGTVASGMRRREVESPCAGRFAAAVLNRLDVQQALHIGGELPVEWVDCQSRISRSYRHSSTALPKYRQVLGRGLYVLIYSGDADSVVNFMGTERWIGDEGLNLSETAPWRAWFGPDQQLAGYTQQYDGLTFKTVKGAGHMVPAVRPLHALHLFDCFLFGEDACRGLDYPIDAPELVAAGVIADAAVPGVGALTAAEETVVSLQWVVLACGVLVVAAGLFAASKASHRRLRRRDEYQPISSGSMHSS